MKLNITKNDAKFIINPDKRKIICIIENVRDLFLDFADDNFSINDLIFIPNSLYKKLKMPNRFIGIATCSPDDEWNEEVGKFIAFSRAKDNLNKSFFKRANHYVDYYDSLLNKVVETINNYGEKIEFNTQKRHDKIEEYLSK